MVGRWRYGPVERSGWPTESRRAYVFILMSALAAPFDLSTGITDARTSTPTPRRRRRADRRATAALRDRRPEALALVMEAHGRTVLGFLSQLLRDRATAEDVLQQVLLEVWQRAASYDPERASLLTWLLTIARSRALDEIRRRVPEPVRSDGGGRTGGRRAGQRGRARPAARAVADRRPARAHCRDEATLLRLRFYDGLSRARSPCALGFRRERSRRGW